MNEIKKKDTPKKVVNLSINNLLPFIGVFFVVLFIIGQLNFIELVLIFVIFLVASKLSQKKKKGSDVK